MVALVAAMALAVQLDTSADAALPCPAHASLAEALQRRASAQSAAEAVFAWDGQWRLTLRRSGAVLLQRSWELPASDCALLADTAALVIDRYFSELRQPQWSPPQRPRRIAALGAFAQPSPPVAAAPMVLAMSDVEPARGVLIPAMPVVAAQAASGQLGAGMVISAGIAALDDLRPGLWLQAERRWASGSASFLMLAGTVDRDSAPGRESGLQSALMAISVGPCFDMLLRACFAPFAGVRGRLASSHRTSSGTELKLVPELGAVVSLEHPLPYRLNAALSLLAGKTLGEADFDPAAPPQEFDYALALRVGYQF